MNSKQIIKQLEADGWFLVRVKGSHHLSSSIRPNQAW